MFIANGKNPPFVPFTTVKYWKHSRSILAVSFLPKLIDFLGYDLFKSCRGKDNSLSTVFLTVVQEGVAGITPRWLRAKSRIHRCDVGSH